MCTSWTVNHPSGPLALPETGALLKMSVHMLPPWSSLAGEVPAEEIPHLLPPVHRGGRPVGRRPVVVEEAVSGVGVGVELVLLAVAAELLFVLRHLSRAG